LSSDPVFTSASTTNDIEGHARQDIAWDIGADEAPTIIYRSVGRHDYDLNTSGETMDITLATNTATATFSADMPAGIGVGDVLQYGSPLTAAFIVERTSPSTYEIRTATGTAPVATSSVAVSVFRAHEFLDDWEDQVVGDVNQLINASLQNSVLVGQDLVASNTAMFVPCYASSSVDNLAVDVSGWTSAASSYIKIYTPTESAEVGESQRHGGIWSDEKYRLVADAQLGVTIQNGFTQLVGLQIGNTYSSNDGRNILSHANSEGNNLISHSILDSSLLTGANTYSISGDNYNNKVFNNIIYNANDVGIYLTSSSTAYNNTVYNCTQGIVNGDGTINAKNNVVFNSLDDFVGVFSILDYNASDDGDGTNAIDISPSSVEADDWAAVFTDYANGDFSIRDIASVLYNSGTTIITVTDDIIGTARPYYESYDIGAFEFKESKPKYRFSPGGTFKFEGDFKFQ